MAVREAMHRTTAPAELLSWDAPVVLAGESRPPAEHERGFVLRLHADPACPDRLVPGTRLVVRSYAQTRAAELCPSCREPAVRSASSSALRRLRDAERTLRRLQARAGDGPIPREIVHCRALRHEAESLESVHPDAPALAAEVVALAGTVAEQLRDSLQRSLAPRRG